MSSWDERTRAERNAKAIRRYGYSLKYADALCCSVQLGPGVHLGCRVDVDGETNFGKLLRRLGEMVESKYPKSHFPRKQIIGYSLEFVNINDIDYSTYVNVIVERDADKVKYAFSWNGRRLEYMS